MKKMIMYAGLILVGAVLVWLLFFKGSRGAKLFKYIPESSAVVMVIDPIAIAEKGNLKEFQKTAIWKKIQEEGAKEKDFKVFEDILKDPLSSGVDFTSYLAMFQTGGNISMTGFIFAIDNQSKFAELAQKLPMGEKTENRSGFSYKTDGSAALAWNGDIGLYLDGRRPITPEDLDAIFNKTTPSINHDASFRKFAKKQSDISVFINYKSFLENSEATKGTIDKMGIPTEFAVVFHINFEKGKISTTSNTIFKNKEDEKKMEWLASDAGINSLELIANHPPIFFLNTKLDMKHVFNFINTMKDGKTTMDEMAKSSGVTKEEMEKLFSGQISLAFLGIKGDSIERKNIFDDSVKKVREDIPVISLFIGINDKAAAEKLLQNLPVIKTENYYKVLTPIMSVFLVKNDKGFIVFSDEDMAKKVASSGKVSDGKFGAASDLAGKHAFSSYLELDMKKVDTETRDFLKAQLQENYTTLDSVLMHFDNMSAWSHDNTTASAELNFKNKDKNALQQLVEIINYGFIKQQEREAKQKEMMRMYQEEMQKQMELQEVPEVE